MLPMPIRFAVNRHIMTICRRLFCMRSRDKKLLERRTLRNRFYSVPMLIRCGLLLVLPFPRNNATIVFKFVFDILCCSGGLLYDAILFGWSVVKTVSSPWRLCRGGYVVVNGNLIDCWQ